jgi:3-oxoacyl-[acyl-carrier-protein] synthase III
MQTSAATILGVGHYVPSKVVTNDDLAKLMTTSDEWIEQRTGIKERRFIEHSGIGASDLALPASKMAIEHAGLTTKDIDAIVFATLSPDHNFPGSGCFLGDKLGLGGVPALDVRNQCSGFLYGLSVADAWVRAGVYRHVLLVGAEVHSTGIELADRGRDVAVLFGDGAGAAVIRPAENGRGVLSTYAKSDGTLAELLYRPGGGAKRPIDIAVLDERSHYVKMAGQEVFKSAVRSMCEAANAAMRKAGVTAEEIDLLVPHQANIRIIESTARYAGMPMDRVFVNVDRYGNMSSASIPVALDEAIEQGRVGEGSLVLLVAFGAGFTWGAAVVRL